MGFRWKSPQSTTASRSTNDVRRTLRGRSLITRSSPRFVASVRFQSLGLLTPQPRRWQAFLRRDRKLHPEPTIEIMDAGRYAADPGLLDNRDQQGKSRRSPQRLPAPLHSVSMSFLEDSEALSGFQAHNQRNCPPRRFALCRDPDIVHPWARTARVTAMSSPMRPENTSPSSGQKSRLPPIGRIVPTASSQSAAMAARGSRR
jgi:hypothetical protein